MTDASTPNQAPPTPRPAGPAQPHTITSRQLFGGAREILIDHDGRLYRMRITQYGKLILTT
jgi:hemin uptake protein HemP